MVRVLSVLILGLVFVLIAVRQVGPFRFQIWQVMLAGAALALASGQISPESAISSINADVLLFLFGMFVVGQAFEESGYLSHLSYRFFRTARGPDSLVLMVIFGAGAASAFLMNDTLAVIGTPVMLHLSSRHGLSPKLLLLSLCFSVSIGSVMSPIGNPQNLLIAVDGPVASPFASFFITLALPTLLNLFLCYILLKALFPRDFTMRTLDHEEEPIKDERLALLSRISLAVIVLLICLKIVMVFIVPGFDFRLTYIALAGALPILMFSPSRAGILSRIDWQTLVFFVSMFVLIQSVWESGFFQDLLARTGADITSLETILALSIVMSQFISNVPLVGLYLPLLLHAGSSASGLLALAAGSTIAGNLTILGAASNVIIIQNAEKRAGQTITFMEFARAGVPLTIINAAVYWAFLALWPS